MSLVARYKPEAPPFVELPEGKRFVSCWVFQTDPPLVGVLGRHRLYKTAVRKCRSSMNDDASLEVNHHTRFYVWNTLYPWNPDNVKCWTPIAERPKDQFVLGSL